MAQKNVRRSSAENFGGLDLSILTLLGGVLMLIGGLFFQPALIDSIFRVSDFRLWAWWYFIVLFLVIAFSVKWFLLYQSWEDLDPTSIDVAKRFLWMSITITFEALLLVILKITWLIRPLYYSLVQWFGFGAFSYMGALTFFLICVAIAMTVYVVKEWFIAVIQS